MQYESVIRTTLTPSANYVIRLSVQAGAVAWRQRCARRLQSAYRGHRARRAYHDLLRRHYTAGLGNPARRRNFLCGQAAERAGKLAAALENRGESIDRLALLDIMFTDVHERVQRIEKCRSTRIRFYLLVGRSVL